MPKGKPEIGDPKPLADLMVDIEEMVQQATRLRGVAFGSAVVALWEIMCWQDMSTDLIRRSGIPPKATSASIGSLSGNLMAYALNHIPQHLRREAITLARQMMDKKRRSDDHLLAMIR